MSKMISLTLFTAGLLAATVLFVPSAPSVAQERPAISTEVSAQQQQQQNKKGSKGRPPRRSAALNHAPPRGGRLLGGPPPRAARSRASPLRRGRRPGEPLRVEQLRRTGRCRARSLGRGPLRAWSGSPGPLRASSGNRRPPVARWHRPAPRRGSLRHAARKLSHQLVCAGCRRAARAARSLAAIATRRGAADTVFAVAATGGPSSGSAPWAPS